jgi:hypothetical protein
MPGPGFSSAPYFSTRVACQYLSSDVPSLSICPANNNLIINNPSVFNVNTGTMAKSDPGVDGLNYIRGVGEYAPFTLDLQWKQIGMLDYAKLAALCPYYIDFISYRNVGYYGRLILNGVKSAGVKVSDVLQLNATFFVLSPSDQGGAATVNRLAVPGGVSVSNSNTDGSGDIPASLPTYYWITFSSLYGETLTTATGAATNSHVGTANTITWTWPTGTAYCEKASIYVSNANDPTTSRLVGEVLNGLTATWTDYVGYQGTLVDKQPPLVNTAYRGQWQGGLWANETP